MPKKFNPVWYVVAIPLAGILAALAVVALRRHAPEASADRFSAAAYCARPENFMGNAYAFEAQIDAQLAWEPNVGRLLAVRLPDGGRVAVFVGSDIRENMTVGQRYRIEAEVGADGAICARSLTKL